MTMTPDQCFDEMAVALGVPKDTGYIDLLDLVKGLVEDKMKFAERLTDRLAEDIKPQMDKIKEENKKLKQIHQGILMELCCKDKFDEDVSWEDIADIAHYEENKEMIEKEYQEEYGED
jgi:hypothetical protein